MYKVVFAYGEPTVIGTNFHSDGEFIVTYSGLFNPETKKISIGLSFCNLTKKYTEISSEKIKRTVINRKENDC